MNIQDKPDYKVFASEARGGEVTDFPNLERGWGETIDKTEKIPPMEWFNLVGKRSDEWLLYLTQRGVAEWDAKVKYPQYAMCQLGGKFYIAIDENENKNPVNSQTVWADLAKYLGVDGKLDSNKVVQTTGQSTASVMSQKAITDELITKLNTNAIVQSTGQSTASVMSQKAVTDAIPKVTVNTALRQKNGWFKDADTGIIYQWGTTEPISNGFINVVTPIKFNVILNATVSTVFKGVRPEGALVSYITIESGNKLVITADFQKSSTPAPRSWFAIGY